MANEIKIDLSLTGEQNTARGLKNVGDAADKAGNDLTGMAKDAGFLKTKISETEVEIKKLTKAFNDTGDMDLLKKIRKEKSNLRGLTGLLPSPAEVAKEAVEIGKTAGQVGEKFGESLTKSLMSLRGPGIAALVGLAAAAAPAIGAMVGSAILGAAGGGGIIGGVALAATDARVQDEAAKLGGHLAAAFKDAGEPFIAPTIAVLQDLRAVGVDIAGDLKQGFASIAPVLRPLADGISGLAREAMPGFLKALDAAKPVLRVIANELPAIGESISDFFGEISSESDGAIMGFITLSKIIQAMIRGSGQFIAGLSGTYESIVRFAAKVAPILEALYGWIPGVGDAITTGRQRIEEVLAGLERGKDASNDFAGGLDNIADSTNKAKLELEALSGAIDVFFGKQMGFDQSVVQWQKGLLDLKKELTDGKRTLSLYTEEGLENRAAMLQQIQAAEELRQKTFEQTGDLQAANAAYQTNIQTLYNMGKAAGFSRDELDRLFAPYLDGPRIAITEFQFPGLTAGLQKARELANLLGSKAAAAAAGGNYLNDYTSGTYVSGRASGGPVMAGQTYVVGEDGPEVLQMGSANGFVHDATATKAMMSGASGGASMGAAGWPVLNLTWVPSGNPVTDAFIAMIWPSFLKQVRLDGGDLSVFGAE